MLFGAPLLAHYTTEWASKIPTLVYVAACYAPVPALATKSMAATVATGIIVAVAIPMVLEMIDEAHRNHASSTAHATRSAAASSSTQGPADVPGGGVADDSRRFRAQYLLRQVELPNPTDVQARFQALRDRAYSSPGTVLYQRRVWATTSTVPSVTVTAVDPTPRAGPSSSRPSSGARASVAKQGVAAEPEGRRSPGPAAARMPRRPTVSLRKRARAPSTEAQVSRLRRRRA